MRFTDRFTSQAHRFSLGIEEETRRPYVSIPVSNGATDYEEFYELSGERYEAFLAEPGAAVPFVEECRGREHDDLIIQPPGWNRGTPV